MADWLSGPLANLGYQQVVTLALWGSLGLLTATLVTLLFTRWGGAEPLGKCVVLSLWAHLLLAVYSTTVHIVFTPPPGYKEGTVTIRLADLGHEMGDVAPTSSEASARDSRTLEPWERFADSPSIAAESPALSRTTATASELHRSTVDLPPAQPAPTTRPAAAPLPVPVVPSVAGTHPDHPQAKEAEPIDHTPVADSRPAPAVNVGHQVNKLPRIAEPPNDTRGYFDGADDPATGDAGHLPVAPSTLAALQALIAGSAGEHLPTDAARPAELKTARPAAVADHPLPDVYKLRVADRARIAQLQGGSADTEAAVNAALRWLAKNQGADGGWDASQFGAGREMMAEGRDRRGAGIEADTGVSGLALLAFLGSGHTHLRGDYQDNVTRGLEYLLRIQGSNGNLGGRAEVFSFMYCHGMAALALSEAYAVTGDERLLPAVRAAVAYTLAAQNPTTGGWRYRPQDTGDTSQLGWQLMVLKSAELAGLSIPAKHRDGMVRFLQSVSSGDHGGLASYRPGEQVSRTMTAEALVCREFLGLPSRYRASEEACNFVLEELPGLGKPNFYYWYYATLGLYQLQGSAWRRWNEALSGELVGIQRREGALAGSWDPDPVWGGYGGRVYSTALGALCLEVYYRYLPLYIEAAGREKHVK